MAANHGLGNLSKAHWNLSNPVLYEEAVRKGEAKVSQGGALVVATGKHTGRAANDKFIVKNAASEGKVWWGKVNKPFDQDKFDRMHQKVLKHIADKEVYPPTPTRSPSSTCPTWPRTPRRTAP